MRAFVLQLARLVAALLGVYGLLLVITLAAYPHVQDTTPLDVNRAGRSLFVTEPKYVLMNLPALATPRERVIFVGASNTVVGFPQSQVAPLLPGVEVDNLGVGGANLTEMAQIVDLSQASMSAAGRRQTTYVINIWYGEFAQNRVKWDTPDRHAGDTDINVEEYRYGLYRRTPEGAQPLVPARDLPMALTLLRPYLLLDKATRQATATLRVKLLHEPAGHTAAERDAIVPNDGDKAQAMDYWQTQMQRAPLAREQFDVLHDLIARVLAQGSEVVVVNLPIPVWHMQRSPFYASYLKERDAVLADFAGARGFHYVDMGPLDNDLDFSDEVHPKPRVTPQWAATIAAALRPEMQVAKEGS